MERRIIKFLIDSLRKILDCTGRNLENSDELKTVGGSVGTSGVGINYSNSEKEGITRNTVIGNIEIANTNNSDINYDITKANEITKDSSSSTNVYVEDNLVKAIAKPEEFKQKVEVVKIEVDSLKNSITKTIDNILNGDKSQDISKAERRQLKEIKEAVIRVQTAKEIEIIATKDLTDPKVQAELGVEIERFNPNDPNLAPAVRKRLEEIKNKAEELGGKDKLGAFYDKVTGKIFVNEALESNKIRPAIAREWKIKEELEANKGILNAEGKQRATVAGEIAYDEALGRVSKEKPMPIDMSKLNSATMNADSEVSADLITEKDRKSRILLRDTYVYKNLPDSYRTALGAGEVVGSATRAGRAYVLVKIGAALIALPDPILATKVVGAGLIVYGVTEGAFATSNAIEGIQDTYYGLTNQKEKEAINPGKILVGENEYMILDNISASGVNFAYQYAGYTKVLEEGKESKRRLEGSQIAIQQNFNTLSNSEKDIFNKYEESGWKGQFGKNAPPNAGKEYKNLNKALPEIKADGSSKIAYKEYDINNVRPRDSKRFVKGSDGSIYYTDDHYKTFKRIK